MLAPRALPRRARADVAQRVSSSEPPRYARSYRELMSSKHETRSLGRRSRRALSPRALTTRSRRVLSPRALRAREASCEIRAREARSARLSARVRPTERPSVRPFLVVLYFEKSVSVNAHEPGFGVERGEGEWGVGS